MIPTETANDNTTFQSSTSAAQGNLWQLNSKENQEIQKFQKVQKTQKPKSRIWPHNNFRISPHCVPHMEKVFSIVRKIYDRTPTDDLNDLDVNTAICFFFFVCHTPSCSSPWTILFNEFTIRQESIFEVCGTPISATEKLIKEQTEIIGLSTTNWDQPMWKESSLLCGRAVRIMNSKTYVFF